MASSSDASRKRRGKAVVVDEDTFDAHRFKTPFHEHFFNSNVASKPIILDTRFNLEEDQYPQIRQQIEFCGWKRLNKPKKRISQTIIREFYANARIDPNNEVGPRFHTFVRGMLVNFRAVWSLGARNNPLYLKRSDLNPVTRGWHEFIIHNIMPTTNQSEVTLNRVVLIHCIMSSQEVRVEKIIVDAMMNIINKLHTSKPPLAFPNIIARLCEEMEISFLASGPVEAMPKKRYITPAPADGYGWGKLQEDMANMKAWQVQHQFQQDVRNYQEQQREQFQSFQKEQEKLQKELTNYKKNFSSHMGKLHAAHEEQKTKIGQTNQVLVNHALDSQAGNMYTHWALQQANQNLVPMIPTKIPPAIRENFKAGRPLFHGMLHPWPPEGSSNALGQQATPAVDVPRNPNAKSDDEN
ncbi:hypothetical protein PIB30_099912 [Stylosanthes scabra]|uniref:Putative plant transposon protein domain-containing protein n=1 Tax=Stylosanthes scabra TaxID=79078 RepID=A0ABU6XW07_9FABA|nr:hypothetical protein [Stylosanthes scabra]